MLTKNLPRLKDNPALAKILFGRLDADKNGFLSLDEFKKITDFKKQNDPVPKPKVNPRRNRLLRINWRSSKRRFAPSSSPIATNAILRSPEKTRAACSSIAGRGFVKAARPGLRLCRAA